MPRRLRGHLQAQAQRGLGWGGRRGAVEGCAGLGRCCDCPAAVVAAAYQARPPRTPGAGAVAVAVRGPAAALARRTVVFWWRALPPACSGPHVGHNNGWQKPMLGLTKVTRFGNAGCGLLRYLLFELRFTDWKWRHWKFSTVKQNLGTRVQCSGNCKTPPLGHLGQAPRVGSRIWAASCQARNAIASPACLLFSGRPKDRHFHIVHRSTSQKSVPQAGGLCWSGMRGSLAVSPPSCLLGKVLPKVHPPQGFGTPLARCTGHSLKSSLACLPLLGWVMWSWPVSISRPVTTTKTGLLRQVGRSWLTRTVFICYLCFEIYLKTAIGGWLLSLCE